MKKQVAYFVSSFVRATALKKAVNEVEEQRNEFLNSHDGEILEIEGETLQTVYTSPHNSEIAVIITLTYYTKK